MSFAQLCLCPQCLTLCLGVGIAILSQYFLDGRMNESMEGSVNGWICRWTQGLGQTAKSLKC